MGPGDGLISWSWASDDTTRMLASVHLQSVRHAIGGGGQPLLS
jgi:hypothetical protein